MDAKSGPIRIQPVCDGSASARLLGDESTDSPGAGRLGLWLRHAPRLRLQNSGGLLRKSVTPLLACRRYHDRDQTVSVSPDWRSPVGRRRAGRAQHLLYLLG